jgi:O-antigen/teichoic acid export membrane protein
MAISTAVTVPLSNMVIRNYIGDNLGWDQAGYWQGIWYISTMYLMVVTTPLSVYYLPRLSEIKSKKHLRLELLQGYKVIIPLVIVMSVTIFYLRDFIILTLFTDQFAPIRDLFMWQLFGDVVKIAAWLLSYVVLAKAMVKLYIVSEVIFGVIFTVLSIILVDKFGLVGVSYAFAINYVLYFFTMILMTKSHWYGHDNAADSI